MAGVRPQAAVDRRGPVPFNRGMSESLPIRLGERSYTIVIGADLRAELAALVAGLREAGRPAAVVTDAHLAERQGAVLAACGDLPRLVLPPGEETKSLASLGRVLDFLAELRIDRSGVVLAFGGGVIGDLAGFAAATYLRGLDVYQIPTSLLAMVDSAVGGKTGINLRAGKNLVGAFHQPRGVFIATGLLATLPPREFAAGLAEVVKYGLLGDAALFAELERARLTAGSAELPAVIRRCCALKAAVVEGDERELAPAGGRALLNLGHTFGHAIEQVTGYGAYLHGEAVAIGLAAAARLSRHLGTLPEADVARIERVLAAHQLPVRLGGRLAVPDLLAAMARDKKVRAGLPRFVVLQRIGEAQTRSGVDPALVEAVWREVGAG